MALRSRSDAVRLRLTDSFRAKRGIVRGLVSCDSGLDSPMIALRHRRRLARKISRALPELWFLLDDDHIRGGVFYQRTGKYNLELIPASRMRLRRSIRWGYFGDLDALTPPRRRARQDQAAQPDR